MLFTLRKCANDMRHSDILAFTLTRPQLDLFPITGLQEPLICGPRDIAAVEKVRPDDVNPACIT